MANVVILSEAKDLCNMRVAFVVIASRQEKRPLRKAGAFSFVCSRNSLRVLLRTLVESFLAVLRAEAERLAVVFRLRRSFVLVHFDATYRIDGHELHLSKKFGVLKEILCPAHPTSARVIPVIEWIT
jgi:hypothetical protein